MCFLGLIHLGGQTWNALNVSFGIDLLVLACAASGNSAVVTSIFGEVWTSSGGDSWKHSLGGGMSQSAHKFDDDTTGTKFGVTGTFKGAQGVAVSKNSGMYLNDFSAGLFTEARYGAFTSDNVWYVAAGQWPSQNTAAEPKRRSVFQDAKGKFPLSYTRPENLQDDGYMAQITVTKDAGKTWTTVFAQNGIQIFFPFEMFCLLRVCVGVCVCLWERLVYIFLSKNCCNFSKRHVHA